MNETNVNMACEILQEAAKDGGDNYPQDSQTALHFNIIRALTQHLIMAHGHSMEQVTGIVRNTLSTL